MFSRHAAASGNTAAIRSSACMRCSCGGTFEPPRLRGTASEIVVFQRQRVANTGASRNAWTRISRTDRRMQIAEDVGQRERVLRAERQHQRVLGGRRLQLEVELPAEPLAQRQRPRPVDAAAERRVQDELHAARLVEEALERRASPASGSRRAQRGPRADTRPPARAAASDMPVSRHEPFAIVERRPWRS